MLGIIIVSHGKLAEGMIDSLRLFFGEINNVSYLTLNSEESPDDFFLRLNEIVNTFSDMYQRIVIMADIFGGTPCNCAMKFLDKCEVVTGFNLPLLIDIMCKTNYNELNLENIVNNNRETMKYIVKDFCFEQDDF